jgi:hypothetical protein
MTDTEFIIEALRRRGESIYRCKLPSKEDVERCERLIVELKGPDPETAAVDTAPSTSNYQG